jgi:putative hydrolase of the HAD superfamily
MNLVFDLGGVLFHWQPHEIVASVLPDLAPTRAMADRLVSDIFQGYGGDWGEFDRGMLAPAPLADRIARRTGLSVAQARAVIDAVPGALVPMAGTVKLLERLHRRGSALFFLSNMPEPYARHLEATHAFLGLFRHGLFSADVRMIKPEPAIFAHAAERFGVDPAQTLFIDDLTSNIEAAREAGWQGLHFQSPQQCEDELVARRLLPRAAE